MKMLCMLAGAILLSTVTNSAAQTTSKPQMGHCDMTTFPYHERSAEQPDNWPTARFDLVPYCSDVHGIAATEGLWQTLGFGDTFEEVRKKAADGMELLLRYEFSPEWVPSTQAILESIKLVPARLQKNGDTWSTRTDRVYCEFESHGRQFLVVNFGMNNSDSYTGISITLMPDEQEVYRNKEYDRLNTGLQALLNLVLANVGGCTPFETTITTEGAGQTCKFRGKNVNGNLPEVPDAPPSNSLSAMAGTLTADKLTVVFRNARYVRDPDTCEFLLPPEPAAGFPADTMFERYVRIIAKETEQSSKQQQ